MSWRPDGSDDLLRREVGVTDGKIPSSSPELLRLYARKSVPYHDSFSGMALGTFLSVYRIRAARCGPRYPCFAVCCLAAAVPAISARRSLRCELDVAMLARGHQSSKIRKGATAVSSGGRPVQRSRLTSRVMSARRRPRDVCEFALTR
jgi:hypothetical protein